MQDTRVPLPTRPKYEPPLLRRKQGSTQRDKLEGMEEIFIRDDMIRLGQFLKLANLVEDGAQAREVIQHGLVKVNGDIEEARGKQLHPGDTVSFNGVTVKVAHED